jgi:hypothetical protein
MLYQQLIPLLLSYGRNRRIDEFYLLFVNVNIDDFVA